MITVHQLKRRTHEEAGPKMQEKRVTWETKAQASSKGEGKEGEGWHEDRAFERSLRLLS